jgi:hypothetical protein
MVTARRLLGATGGFTLGARTPYAFLTSYSKEAITSPSLNDITVKLRTLAPIEIDVGGAGCHDSCYVSAERRDGEDLNRTWSKEKSCRGSDDGSVAELDIRKCCSGVVAAHR